MTHGLHDSAASDDVAGSARRPLQAAARQARFRTAKRRARRSSPPARPTRDDIARFVNHFAWQGKTFDAEKGVLRNRILPFGLNAIIAKVYKAPSWLDGKECIVLDYSETSLVAHWIRDEIRQIGPGMYLGKVYWDKKRLIDFALQFGA